MEGETALVHSELVKERLSIAPRMQSEVVIPPNEHIEKNRFSETPTASDMVYRWIQHRKE